MNRSLGRERHILIALGHVGCGRRVVATSCFIELEFFKWKQTDGLIPQISLLCEDRSAHLFLRLSWQIWFAYWRPSSALFMFPGRVVAPNRNLSSAGKGWTRFELARVFPFNFGTVVGLFYWLSVDIEGSVCMDGMTNIFHWNLSQSPARLPNPSLCWA